MIDQQLIDGVMKRGKKFAALLQDVQQGSGADQRALRQELEGLQAKLNAASKIIPTLAADQKKATIAELKPISDRVADLKQQLAGSTPIVLPNCPRPDVPAGDDESSNLVLREVGRRRDLPKAQTYLDLVEPQGLIDIKRAAKVSGSRFGYLLGPVAQLEFALIQYAQTVILRHGFTLVVPPVMIKEENMEAMGYLHGGGEEETYHLTKDKLYLVGTSEQSIGPMHRDEVFTSEELPRRYLSFSTCFRREAGSYGKDTKGILRVHQFDKLEMFSLTTAETSDQEHELFLALEEKIWQGLDIPYRVVNLCAGDLSWPSARTYDIEAWMPGQQEYREVSSTSTTTDWQSRHLNIKYQTGQRKELVHMLNGTAVAVGRTIIALLENYQRPDGSIDIPKVLRPYMGGVKRISRRAT